MAIPIRPTLLPAPEYLADLTERINEATTRIVILTMVFHNDSERIEALILALCEAAERGVTVVMCADSFTYLEPNSPWRRFIRGQSSQAYRALRAAHRLKNSGVQFRWLGRNANVGVMGRTHAKWSIVDDTVYSFGGVNIHEMGIENTDYMFRISNKELADILSERFEWLIRSDRGNHAGRNRIVTLSSKTRIILDGGIPFNSKIYSRAIALAKQADEILFVSQYCPTGRLATFLHQKKSRLYFNHWEDAGALNTFVIRAGMRASKLTTSYKRDPYLHAKFMIFTMPDGNKVALTGSHNFVAGGVMLGTREICLETTSEVIIGQLEAFFESSVR